MATERVDWRVPSGGLAGLLPFEFSGIAFRSISFSSSVLMPCLFEGEAGIVLSLFLISPTPAARKDDMPDLAVGRELALEGSEVFVGEAVLALPTGFLSEVVDGWIADFLSEESLLEVFGPAIDNLLGAPSGGFGFFSSPDMIALVVSSTELTDVRGLWPLAALIELAVGFRRVEPMVGLVGGLLRVVPVVGLAVAADVVFKAVVAEGLGFAVELVIFRLGIEPAFDFGGVAMDSSGCCSAGSRGSSIVQDGVNISPEKVIGCLSQC